MHRFSFVYVFTLSYVTYFLIMSIQNDDPIFIQLDNIRSLNPTQTMQSLFEPSE